jgi:hypothetical protein
MKPLHGVPRSASTLAVVAAALLAVNSDSRLCGTAALGQTAFDPPEVRAAADVVPPALLAGPHYRVGPTVTTFAFMNRYSVTSDYGPFTAPSDARLRRLVREIAAIAELQKIHQSDAFAKATVEAGKGVVQGARHLIENPVATIGAVPEAVFSVFGRVSEAAKRGGKSKYEGGVAQNLLAVSSFKREYAQKFDIDVYSTNEVLQRELNSVAWASAAGNLTLSAASMVTGLPCFRSQAVCARSSRPKASSMLCRQRSSPGATGRPCAKCVSRTRSRRVSCRTRCRLRGTRR